MDNEKPEEKIETYDEKRKVGILSGKPPSDVKFGPRRKAPMYYAGEFYGRHVIQYPDVERHKNGALPSKRNKHMRRIIRGALKRTFSRVERGLKLPRAMQAQAREIARDEKKSTRWARRLYDQELAIHRTLPNEPSRAQRRGYARKLKREGKQDAISQLVDKMTTGVKL